MEKWMIEHLLPTSLLLVMFAAVLITLTFLGLHRMYPHEATKSQVSGAFASLAIALLFSVFLNNLFAIGRDRDNRLRTLRDQHLVQLRPVLRTESAKLQEIATQITKEAHISRVAQVGAEENPTIALWPEVLSQDLQNHFADYDKAKRALFSEINSQDEEFRTTLALVEQEVIDKPDAYWQEIVAMSFIEMCLGRQAGIKLVITDNGYSFEYLGGAMSNSGGGASPPRPSADQLAAYRAFRSLKPDAALGSRCESLKRRAESIRHDSQDLSRDALLLSQSTFLRGMCDFVRSTSLLD